jgi:hypothetical protein
MPTFTGAAFCALGPGEPAKLVAETASASEATAPAAKNLRILISRSLVRCREDSGRTQYALRVAETLSAEQVPARLAQIRDQLKLLADYL